MPVTKSIVEHAKKGRNFLLHANRARNQPLLAELGKPQICCVQERARYEAQAMAEEYAHCPQHVPKLHLYDADMALIVMQYLEPPHNILRQGFRVQARVQG